jgi:hypothetical protein
MMTFGLARGSQATATITGLDRTSGRLVVQTYQHAPSFAPTADIAPSHGLRLSRGGLPTTRSIILATWSISSAATVPGFPS